MRLVVEMVYIPESSFLFLEHMGLSSTAMKKFVCFASCDFCHFLNNLDYKGIYSRIFFERERERDQLVVPFIYAFIGCFLTVP